MINCTLEVLSTGSPQVCRIIADNGRIVAELLVHGHLDRVIENCADNTALVRGKANLFRGECYQLANFEYLDVENNRIVER